MAKMRTVRIQQTNSLRIARRIESRSQMRLFPPSGKLTWQWNMDLLKICTLLKILLKMVIFHCHVSLLDGSGG